MNNGEGGVERSTWAQGWKGIRLLVAGIGVMLSGPLLAGAYEEVPIPQGASLVGTVKFSGTRPESLRYNVKMGSNPEYCKIRADEKGDVVVPQVQVSAAHELAEVVVFLQEVEKGKALPPEGPKVEVDLCRFAPHVTTGVMGQSLRVGSQDSILHQVRGWEYMGKNRLPTFMASNLKAGAEQAVPLQVKRSGILQLTCDQHRFMEGWVLVTANPYATVTDQQGRFSLTDIPPGTHTLGAWHPVLGYQEAKVTVTAGHQTSVTLTMTPATAQK